MLLSQHVNGFPDISLAAMRAMRMAMIMLLSMAMRMAMTMLLNGNAHGHDNVTEWQCAWP